jgi:hypothetical protein
MAFLDKELLISAGLGGVVGLGIGAAFLSEEDESSSSKLLWFLLGGAVLAGGAVKFAGPKTRHLVGYEGLFFAGAGASFEDAWSHAAQKYDPSSGHVPDLTADQLARPFAGGAFLNACGAPEDMGVTIKAAVQNGHAVGVTVTTSPPNPRIAACIDAAVRRMAFPPNPNLDAVTQTF